MLVIAVISLLCSAFFSGIEIAFVSANKLQLELDKNSKHFTSKFISYFSKSDSDFITTMLVGNNISLVIYGVFMTKILYPLLIIYSQSDFVLLLLQTIITTLIVLLVAEFLPKVIFKIYPNFILNFLCIPIWIFFILLRPVTILFLKISNWILKYIFNQKDQKTQPTFSKTDLDDYLSNIKNNNFSEDNRIEVEMLQNALDLSERKIRECMVPRTNIIAFDVTSKIEDLKRKFIETKLSKIIIFRGSIDRVIGYVHSSDLFRMPRNIKSVLMPIQFVPESMSAMELLNQFIEENRGLALVVDEFGGTAGLVTIEDVTEEIVGEIEDEHDMNEITDVRLSENVFKMYASLDVDLINKKYDLDLPENEEYKTIAGLILHYHENIPEKNQLLVVEEKFNITILDVNQNAIQEVQIEVVGK